MKEDIIHRQLYEHHFPGSVKAEESQNVSCLEAYTDLGTQRITMRFNPQFNPRGKTVQRLAQIKGVHSQLDECLKDGTAHECGHVHLRDGRGCPGNVEEHEEHFYAPIHAVMEKKKKEGAVDSVTNLVEDLIDNTLLAQLQSSTGLVVFYDHAAQEKKGHWDKAFEAYMRVQTYCWADAKEREVLSRDYTSDEKVIAAARNIIARLHLKRGDATETLSDKAKWKEISTVVAEELSDLIETSSQSPICGFGKSMKEAMQDPTNRQKFAVKRYSKKEGRPQYMKPEEALDHVYSYEAKQIPLKVKSISRQESFPVVPYQHSIFNPEEDTPEQINFSRPAIVAKSPFGGHVSFQVAREHYELPLQVKMGMKSFPRLKYGLVDCSPSMKEGLPNAADPGSKVYIPWGDKSKYHYSCKGYYGIVEFLARQGILPNVEVCAGVFSDETYIGKGLEEIKRILLHPHFGRTTQLDLEKVEQMFSGEQSIFFTISDGEIFNWSTIADKFIQLARKHQYFHLQIGPDSVATQSLKKAGLPVYPIRTGEELEQIAIDLTQQAYSNYIDSVAAELRGSL